MLKPTHEREPAYESKQKLSAKNMNEIDEQMKLLKINAGITALDYN